VVVAKTRKVVFGRINRRNSTLDMRPFAQDMLVLAESRLTTFTAAATPDRPARTWYAADMKIVSSGDFMVGVFGFSVNEEKRFFDTEAWSWVKGETESSDAASEDTVVPFAVDLRDHHRWVAFATTGRVQPAGFRLYFGKVLTEAAARAGLLPADWECDPVVSRDTIHDWIHRYPRVKLLRRRIKFTNPGRNLDDDRAEMRALGARRKLEEIAAYPNKDLDTGSEAFEAKLDGVETGDLEVYLESRVSGGSDAKFDSEKESDELFVDDFGTDLERGMDQVLRTLVGYAQSHPVPDGH
jgi:hypothetical protein